MFVSDDRFLNLVGGWDGTCRTSSVITFDTRHKMWLPSITIGGFPTGGGLSSHTATPLANGGALIVGRLGGFRTQRKSSAVLSLIGNPIRGFNCHILDVLVESRSGHSTVPISAKQTTVIGGRTDAHCVISVDKFRLPNSGRLKFTTTNFLVDAHLFQNQKSSKSTVPSNVRPSGRRYHIAMSTAFGFPLLHGGEDFNYNHRSSNVHSELLYFDPVLDHWCPLPLNISNGLNSPSLYAHCAEVIDRRSMLFFGGFDQFTHSNCCTYQLSLDEGA